ncbi:proximal sequence element A Pbp95 [Lycorma delicatula]|uniref:proximal sequence element A Pbp95 n=1 Tax=Lycorma delicatula TaxID=130591 RepID=UPI003F519F2D
METSSDGKKENYCESMDLCEKISKFVQDNDSTAVPVINVVGVSSVDNVDSTFDDELDDLVEEQLVLNKIKEMQNARMCLVNNKEPIIKDLDDCDSSKVAYNCDEDSLLGDSFMDASRKNYIEERIHKENLEKISKALTLNVLMQSELTQFESFLMSKLKENQKRQVEVKAEINQKLYRHELKRGSGNKDKSRSWYSKFGIPYFKDEQRFTCPHNADFRSMSLNNQMITINLNQTRMWRIKDKLALEQGVKKCLIEENCSELYDEEAKLKAELNKRLIGKEEDTTIKKQLKCISNKIDAIKKKSLLELISKCPPDREFDWLRIETEYVHSHSAQECQRMWHLYIKPSVNRKNWTRAEDKRLISLVEKHNKQDWDSIAKCLGTSRTGYQCFVNYQTRLNKELKKLGKWTKEEDERLVGLVAKCRIGNYIPWPKIAYYFDGRSLAQIYCRWTSSLNPELKKGRFSKVEDKLIVSFVRKFGEDFPKMSKFIGDRTSVQLRERYSRAVPAKYQNSGRWSYEEDELLMSLVEKYGVSQWSAISKQFVTRTRTQIRHRYSAIKQFMEKYPDHGIKHIHRGPKAKAQNHLSTSVAKFEAAKHKENKMLADLIRENNVKEDLLKRQNYLLIGKIKRGRKRIVKRSELDNKLIRYFKEVYTNDKLRLKTSYNKPDVSKAADALSLFCHFFKTRLVLSGDEFHKSLKQIPVTLRDVLLRLIEDNKTRTEINKNNLSSHGHASLFPAGNQYEVASIDCLPVNPKDTLVSDSYYLLCDHSELPELCDITEKKNNPNLKTVNKNFIPFYLPPNIITSIGFRSVLIVKDKIAFCLNHQKKKTVCLIHDEFDIKKNGLKKFTGYFSDENENDDGDCNDEQLSENYDRCVERSASVVNADLSTKKNNVSVISLPSTSQDNSDHTIVYLPSTSSTEANSSMISLPSTSCCSNQSSLKDSVNEFYIYNDKPKENISDVNVRLTKEEAVSLWKERLMAVFGWPMILSHQPPDFSENNELSREENIEIINEVNAKPKQPLKKVLAVRKGVSDYSLLKQAYIKDIKKSKTGGVLKTCDNVKNKFEIRIGIESTSVGENSGEGQNQEQLRLNENNVSIDGRKSDVLRNRFSEKRTMLYASESDDEFDGEIDKITKNHNLEEGSQTLAGSIFYDLEQEETNKSSETELKEKREIEIEFGNNENRQEETDEKNSKGKSETKDADEKDMFIKKNALEKSSTDVDKSLDENKLDDSASDLLETLVECIGLLESSDKKEKCNNRI